MPKVSPERLLKQIQLLKWCYLGMGLISLGALLLFYGFYFATQTLTQVPPNSNITIEELLELKQTLNVLICLVSLIGFSYIPLTILTFLKLHQLKKSRIILNTAIYSLILFPLGSLLGIVTIVLLYQNEGIKLFKDIEE